MRNPAHSPRLCGDAQIIQSKLLCLVAKGSKIVAHSPFVPDRGESWRLHSRPNSLASNHGRGSALICRSRSQGAICTNNLCPTNQNCWFGEISSLTGPLLDFTAVTTLIAPAQTDHLVGGHLNVVSHFLSCSGATCKEPSI